MWIIKLILILGIAGTVRPLICQTSLCVMYKDPKYDCRHYYLAAHVQCGSNEELCFKMQVFNTTVKTTTVETRQHILVSRSPLVSVIRGCYKNSFRFKENACSFVPKLSPPYEGYVCVCNTDYCNRGIIYSLTQLHFLLLIEAIAVIYFSFSLT